MHRQLLAASAVLVLVAGPIHSHQGTRVTGLTGHIVDGDDVEFLFVSLKHRPQSQAADAAKAIDRNSSSHSSSLV
jgi:hypothetical protein